MQERIPVIKEYAYYSRFSCSKTKKLMKLCMHAKINMASPNVEIYAKQLLQIRLLPNQMISKMYGGEILKRNGGYVFTKIS